MLTILFVVFLIYSYAAFSKEYNALVSSKEIEELVYIKNSKKILEADKMFINSKIKEISADFKITYFEFLKIKLLFNQSLKNVDSSKKEAIQISKIVSLSY